MGYLNFNCRAARLEVNCENIVVALKQGPNAFCAFACRQSFALTFTHSFAATLLQQLQQQQQQ